MNSYTVSWLFLFLWEPIEFSFLFRKLCLLFLNCWVESQLYSISMIFLLKNLRLHSTSVHLSETVHHQNVWTSHMKFKGHWLCGRGVGEQGHSLEEKMQLSWMGGWNMNRIFFLVSALTQSKVPYRQNDHTVYYWSQDALESEGEHY